MIWPYDKTIKRVYETLHETLHEMLYEMSYETIYEMIYEMSYEMLYEMSYEMLYEMILGDFSRYYVYEKEAYNIKNVLCLNPRNSPDLLSDVFILCPVSQVIHEDRLMIFRS